MLGCAKIDLQAIAGIFLVAAFCGAAPPDEQLPAIETVPIAGATFTTGTPLKRDEPGYHDDERPLSVTVKTFRIGKFPVTANEMCAFLNSEAAQEDNRRSLYNHEDIGQYTYSTIARNDDGNYVPRARAETAPANQVTWKGAVLFCHWLSEETGKEYRLPSEAEWELAARGPEGRKWPWGDAEPDANYGYRYAAKRLSWTTTPVGSHPANATNEGVHDLLAYVIGEWCANVYVAHPTPDQMTDARADLDDMTSPRVVRGYYHRYYRRGGFLLRMTEWGIVSHRGRPWTRVGCDPLKEVNHAARHGFRVVEVIPNSEGK
jgi:formylglycine-generating enzyme required for sulfatase activity